MAPTACGSALWVWNHIHDGYLRENWKIFICVQTGKVLEKESCYL
jgi:hypothetical protein